MSLEGNFLKNLLLPEYSLSLNLPTFGTRCKIILHAHVLPNSRPRSPWHSAHCCLSLSFNIVCRCLSTRPAASQPALGNPPLCPHLLQLPAPGSCVGLNSVKAYRHNSSASPVPSYGIGVLPGPRVAWRAIPWVRESLQPHAQMKASSFAFKMRSVSPNHAPSLSQWLHCSWPEVSEPSHLHWNLPPLSLWPAHR